jgi:hypothetical protein
MELRDSDCSAVNNPATWPCCVKRTKGRYNDTSKLRSSVVAQMSGGRQSIFQDAQEKPPCATVENRSILGERVAVLINDQRRMDLNVVRI